MKYRSTRSSPRASTELFSFKDVLFAPGYAKDGGLYVCDHIPSIARSDMQLWKTLKYPAVMSKILRLFTTEEELTDTDIEGIVASSFQDFELPDQVVSLKKLDSHLYIAELFQGPTLAFKDLSLAVLAKLLEFFMKNSGQGKRVKILVGTSGDTGPAAAHSVANLDGVDLVLLYPLNRVSKLQEMQMLTVSAPNVCICAVEGNSDELDQPIKECFQDVKFSAENNLGSFNSLQWGRVLLQAAHYIYIYLQCCPSIGEELHIIVPTGAAGNLAAGFLAHEMGFPIKLIASVNSNDILARSFQNGDYSPSPDVKASLAPAMDIQAPYNIERLLYFATRDSEVVRTIMESYEKAGKTELPEEILILLRKVILDSISVNDEDIKLAMQDCYKNFKYVLCPHTATAYSYASNARRRDLQNKVIVCLATASPAKFPEACLAAGLDTPTHDRLERLKSQSQLYSPRHVFSHGQDWTSQLKNIILNL